MPLKLGSNWKSVGIGTDMRRWAHGNARVTIDPHYISRSSLFYFRSTLGSAKVTTTLEEESVKKLMTF